MLLFIMQLTSIVCMGLALLMIFILLLQESARSQDAGPSFVTIHHALVHRYGRVMGITETIAFVATLTMTILLEGQWTLFWLGAVTWICAASMIAIWVIRIYPINKRIDLWQADYVPADWPKVRSRWHRLHLERAAFAVLGMIALIVKASIG